MRNVLIITLFSLLAVACVKPAHRSTETSAVQYGSLRKAPEIQLAPRRQLPAIDPSSTEAATDMVRAFIDLLNAGKFDEAYMLLGAEAPPRHAFDSHFARFGNLHVSMGSPGVQEGAAGSIYLSIPLTLEGTVNHEHSSKSAVAQLRRVNDVPGSTEAQRHWHIDKIEWDKAS